MKKHNYWLPFVLVFLAGLLGHLPFLSIYQGMEDEAITVLGADRILQGEWPYLDWDTRHTPGSYLICATWFLIAGTSMNSVRALMVLNAALLGLVQYCLARRVLTERWAIASWALFFLAGVNQWPILSYHWLAGLAFLSSCSLMVKLVEHPRDQKTVGLLGLSVACTIWLLQSAGLAALLGVIAVGLTLFQFSRPEESPNRSESYSQLRWLVAGLIGGSALLWAPVLLTAGPLAVYDKNVASMSHHLAFNRSPYSWRHLTGPMEYLWTHLSQGGVQWALHSLSYQLVWIIKYGLIGPVWLVSCLVAYRQRDAKAYLASLLLLCQALAYWNRQDMLYLNYLTPLFYVCLVFLIRQLRYRVPIMIALLTVFGLQCGFGLKETYDCIYPIETPRGRLWTNQQAQATYTQALFEWSAQHHLSQSPILAYPYACSVYTLGNLRNAVAIPVLVPLLYSRQELTLALESPRLLEAVYVIRVSLGPEVLQDYPTVDPRAFQEAGTWFDGQLLKRYRLVQTIGPYEIYQSHSAK